MTDEESRLRETLTKKKLMKKQFRRKQSGELDTDNGSSPEKSNNDDNNNGGGNNDDNKPGDNKSHDKPAAPPSKRRRRNRGRRRDRGVYDGPPPPRDNRDYYDREYYRNHDNHHNNNYGRYREPPRWRPPPGRGGRRDSYDDRRGGGPRNGNHYHRPRRSRSPSRSVSRSRSRSGSRDRRRRYDSSRSPSRSRSYSSSRSRGSSRSDSCSPARSDDSHARSTKKKDKETEAEPPVIDESTKDLRTIFVSSLVMKATESDIRRYFRKFVDGPRWTVREVILLRDRRTGRHKGGCYVELATASHVDKALAADGIVPDFQRFPICVKKSEAEKNDFGPLITAGGSGGTVQYTSDGKRIEAQKVYLGSVDPCVTQAQLHAIFSGFGVLEKTLLQVDTTTGISRGFAFLGYKDPKDANLAIQTMSGQMLAGQALKTGWANVQSASAGIEEVRSNDFPADTDEKIKKVNETLVQLTGTGLATLGGKAVSAATLGVLPTSQLQSVAEAALEAALGGATIPTATLPVTASISQPAAVLQPAVASTTVAPPAAAPAVVDATVVGGVDNPTKHILVHNMFNKDEETDPGWETDIRLDFEEECQQYGKIVSVIVMHKDPGGKIYATFESEDGATKCAKNLAGRWFDKRQLRVEFVDSIPSSP